MTEPELVDVAVATTAVVRDVVKVADLPGFFDRSFSVLPAVLSEQGIAIASPAFALYHSSPAETADLEVGFVTEGTVEPDGEVRPGSLPGGVGGRCPGSRPESRHARDGTWLVIPAAR